MSTGVDLIPAVNTTRGSFSLKIPALGFERGEVVGVFGHSGCGKSTYLGELLYRFGRDDAMLLFQQDVLLGHLSGRQNVELGALVGRATKTEAQGLVDNLSKELDLEDLLGRSVERLSGGQRRRVYLAQVLASKLPVVLLDEPFTGLGVRYEDKATELLRRTAAGRRLTVVVSHDLELLTVLCDWIGLMDSGRFVGKVDPKEEWPARVTQRWASVVGVPNILTREALEAVFRVSPGNGAEHHLPKRIGLWPSWFVGPNERSGKWALKLYIRSGIETHVHRVYLRGEWLAECVYSSNGKEVLRLWMDGRCDHEAEQELRVKRLVEVVDEPQDE